MDGEVEEHFRLWLRAGMTGCEFAKLLSGKAGRVAVDLHISPGTAPATVLNSSFDVHAKADRVVIAVLPQIADEDAFVDFLNRLAIDSRWRLLRRKKSSPAGGVLIGLEWTTATGDVSETMGFAPFLSMPVARRAPYVAIATWPGGRSNALRGRGVTPPAASGQVSLLDAQHGFEEHVYEQHWNSTTAKVKSVITEYQSNPGLYRRSAFVVSPACAAKLRFSVQP